MSEAYQLPDFLEFEFLLTAFFTCKFANSHHASFTFYFYLMLSRYITIFVHFYVGFTLFIVLLYFIISQPFSLYTSTFFCDMLSTISSKRWSVLRLCNQVNNYYSRIF